jgi:3-oxoacyl-(acyl-carrier-protein) synthase
MTPTDRPSVLGIGAVTPMGRDLAQIARAFAGPAPAHSDARRVTDQWLVDPVLGKRMRRADRFAKMASLAAYDAWTASRQYLADVPMERIGLIVSSGLGPHNRGFRFIDGILDCGDSAALPTDFSHSVHGAAAAYITELLQLRGPSLSVTDFENGFAQAADLSQCWLQQGVSDRVLLGAVEELGDVLLHCVQRMAGGAIVPGEGAVFFMLGPGGTDGRPTLDATAPPPMAEKIISHVGRTASDRAFEILGGILAGS